MANNSARLALAQLALLALACCVLPRAARGALPAFLSGASGAAMRFKGNAEMNYIEVPYHADLDLSEDFSIEFFVKPETQSYPQAVYSTDGVTIDTTSAWNVYITSSGGVQYEVNNVGDLTTDGGLVGVGDWSHVAVTVSGATSVSIYVNAVLVSSGTVPAPASLGGRNPMIGRRGFNNKYLDAETDEIRLWNRAITADEVLTRMHSRLDGVGDGLVANYNFDVLDGTTARDVAGGHDGTLLQGDYESGGVTVAGDGTLLPERVQSDAPVAGAVCDEDGNVGFSLPSRQTDGPDPAPTVEWTALPAAAAGVLYESADGTALGSPVTALGASSSPFFVFVPAADASGIALTTLAYRSVRAVPAAETAPNEAEFVISVRSVPDAPEAADTFVTGSEDTVIPVYLAGGDADGDEVTPLITSLPPASAGVVYQSLAGGNLALGHAIALGTDDAIVYNNRTVLFVPVADGNGSPFAAFEFQMFDRSNLSAFDGCGFDTRVGTLSVGTATATVEVLPVNDAPVAVDTVARADENEYSAVAFNATDIDTAAATLGVVLASLPQRGALYVPDPAGGSEHRLLAAADVYATGSAPDASQVLPSTLLYRPPGGSCGLLFSTVRFRVWDGEAVSAAAATMQLDVYCEPGAHIMDSSIRYVFGTFAALLVLLVAATLLFTYRFRSLPVIRAHSPRFMELILAGTFFACAASMLGLPAAPSAEVCAARIWCLVLYFVVTFGTLFAKEWRIVAIFGGRVLRQRNITDTNLLVRWGIFATAAVLFLAVNHGINPPSAVRTPDPDDGSITRVTCSYGTPMTASLSAFCMTTIAFGAYLAFKTRNLSSDFDESSGIALSSFNVLFVAVVVGPQLASLTDKPVQHFVLSQLGLLWIGGSTIALLFLPKVVAVIRGETGVRAATSAGTKLPVSASASKRPHAAVSSAAPGSPRGERRSSVSSRPNPASKDTASSTVIKVQMTSGVRSGVHSLASGIAGPGSPRSETLGAPSSAPGSPRAPVTSTQAEH